MENNDFQVDRVDTTVNIWIDSGAEIDECLLAFSHEFESEIEADLIRQRVESLILDIKKKAYNEGACDVCTGKIPF